MALTDTYKVLSSVNYTHFDKVISVQFLLPPSSRKANEAWGTVIVECAPGGPKPGIAFSTEILPGGIATQFRLVLTNFTSEIDIGLFSHMVVTIGYRTSPNRREFTAAIFSSFIETPNPNGRTVFTGLVGDWFVHGLKEVNRNLVFKNPTITMGELLWGVVEGKGPDGIEESPNIKNGGLGLSLRVDLPEWVLNDILIVGKEGQREAVYWTESGYACLNWLLDRVSGYGDAIVSRLKDQNVTEDEAERFRVMATFQDNVVSVFMKGFTKSLDSNNIEYVDLNKITSVTFQGAALSIVAPWNPLLMPGSLFHMQSKYFRGRMAPRQVVNEAARDSADLYRIITMSVEYDTNGPANMMKLLAIRNDSFISTESVAGRMTAVDRAIEARSNVYTDSNRDQDIVFGKDRPRESGERKASWGVKPTTFSRTDGVIRKVRAAETLGSIAIDTYGPLTYYKTPSQGNIDHINEKVPGAYFWPLIAIGNYCMKLNEEPGFEEYTETPDQLVEGRNVFVPTVTNLDALVRLRPIIGAMADQFAGNPQNTWGVTGQDVLYMQLIYYYMGL